MAYADLALWKKSHWGGVKRREGKEYMLVVVQLENTYYHCNSDDVNERAGNCMTHTVPRHLAVLVLVFLTQMHVHAGMPLC